MESDRSGSAAMEASFEAAANTVASLGAPAALLAPRREGIVEGALAGGALFDGDDGAALVDIDQRHVEPRALLEKLQIARAVGIDIRQADQEEAVSDLDRQSGQRRAARLLVGFHQDARHVADAAAGEI